MAFACTVIIPFFQGHAVLQRLVESLPPWPIVVVDDLSDPPLQRQSWMGQNLNILRVEQKGYFAGAVNVGIAACTTDVLVLNQDTWFEGPEWQTLLEQRDRYAMIGERIDGQHPAFGDFGYIHGTFMFLRRDAITAVGPLNQRDYPLWGATAEWQWRLTRKGFEVLPTRIPGFRHERKEGQRFGSSIQTLLAREPEKKTWLTQTPPLVSVIVPCYNYGRYLSDCIHSLIGGETSLGPLPGQTLQSFEVVIVDDASSDETPQVMERLIDLRKGIRGYRLSRNQGTARTLNYGIERANGKYITFLSADDMREAGSLEALVRCCQAHPHSFAYDDVWLFYKKTRTRQWRMEEYDFEELIHKNQIHAGILYPRKAWEEVGGYPGIMNDGREDWAFNVALGVHGWCGEHVHEYGYLYRREDQNRSLTNTTGYHRERFLAKIVSLFPSIYKGDRPMPCCGRGRNAPKPSDRTGKNMVVARTQLINGVSGGAMASTGAAGMVKLQYVGRAMQAVWDGPVTNTRYRFGKDRPLGWVDIRDAGEAGRNGFLNEKDSKGNALFIIDPSSPPVAEPASETVFVQEVSGLVEATTGVETAQSEPLVAASTETGLEYPNPSDLNASEIRSLVLTKEQWSAVYRAEMDDKNRKGVITFIEEQLASE